MKSPASVGLELGRAQAQELSVAACMFRSLGDPARLAIAEQLLSSTGNAVALCPTYGETAAQ
jgi:hypothetical protein